MTCTIENENVIPMTPLPALPMRRIARELKPMITHIASDSCSNSGLVAIKLGAAITAAQKALSQLGADIGANAIVGFGMSHAIVSRSDHFELSVVVWGTPVYLTF